MTATPDDQEFELSMAALVRNLGAPRVPPAAMVPGRPIVFDFGWVAPGAIFSVSRYTERASRFGDRGSTVYRHGRIAAFELVRFVVGNEILIGGDTWGCVPLAMFPALYKDCARCTIGASCSVEITVRNVSRRAQPLCLAVVPLVLE